MDEALNHFSRISALPRSAPLLLLILAANFAITALHSWQEWKGPGAPLWRNFGAIVGLKIPDRAGFLGFTVLLTLTLWSLGLIGIAGWFARPAGIGCVAFALGALIGARLSDTLVSHLLLNALGYRPNPGLSSTPLYVLEALFMIVAFRAGLAADPTSAWWGIAAGAAFFVSVLPGLWLLRSVFPACRREPWRRWQPMPPWASADRSAI
ncbi:MAG: hypothetical protein QOD09_1015 [Bradyrhizobium sp.]|jgi:hypothetical protein|nr:hypothetical protein [Bradyrhizobium sp.]